MDLLPAVMIPDLVRNLVAGLLMIGVLVVIHEFGHFLAAKLFRIDVPVFSVGMGPRLFGVQLWGTDYRVSALPIGGYVQMAGADPFGEEDAESQIPADRDFMKKPVWQRLIVMFAGPAFNLILPFIVFTGVMMAGEPQTAAVVGQVIEGTPAAAAGMQEGDRVVGVNGAPVEVFGDLIRALEAAPDAAHQLTLQRGPTVGLPAGALQFTADGYLDLEALGILSSSLSSRVGVDDVRSPAGAAGLRTGDLITHVDSAEIRTWPELTRQLGQDGTHALQVIRASSEGAQQLSFTLTADPDWAPRDSDPWADRWGLTPVMLYVGKVSPNSAAHSAGIQPLDRLWSIDGHAVHSWSGLMDLVVASGDGGETPRPLDVTVLREGALVQLTLTPRITREVVRGDVRFRPIMGVERYPTAYVEGPVVQKYYRFTEAVPRAIEQGVDVFTATLGVLGKLVTFDLKPQEALGGPVEIFRAAGMGAEQGIHTFARLLGTISFSLGIVNLLPVPVLDGGQIVFYALEGIRGRPLSLALRERVQMIGVLALAALMLMVTVMDVNRWLSG